MGHLLGGSMVGLTATSSKNAYIIFCVTQVYCHQSPCPRNRPLLICASTGDTQKLKGRSGSVSVGVSGSWCTQGFVWALQVSLVGMGFDSKHDFAPPTILLGLLLCTWTQGSFFGGIQHCPVDGCSAVSCSFGGLTGEDDCTSFYSAVLCLYI